MAEQKTDIVIRLVDLKPGEYEAICLDRKDINWDPEEPPKENVEKTEREVKKMETKKFDRESDDDDDSCCICFCSGCFGKLFCKKRKMKKKFKGKK